MNENIYDRINRTLSWKKVATFNVGLLLILIIPLSVQLAQQDTENRSGAAGEIEAPIVTPPPNYPSAAPRLDRVSMFFGKKGDTVVLLGNNFGDYQWESDVYVGNVAAGDENVIRWSNSVIEVKIPESARSGKVWVRVNGSEASWDGTLLLYDNVRVAKVGLKKLSANAAALELSGAGSAQKGIVEYGYVSEPVTLTPSPDVTIEESVMGADALGKKMLVRFQLNASNSNNANIMEFSHPGIGAIELVRVELYDGSGNLLPLYVDPLAMKVLP